MFKSLLMDKLSIICILQNRAEECKDEMSDGG